MYWPKFSKKKLFSLLRKQRKAKYGIAANYVRWTKYTGLKLFRKKRARDFAYKTQMRAAQAGLGPKVGGELVTVEVMLMTYDEGWGDERYLSVSKLYGYFTEHAPPLGSYLKWNEHGPEESNLYEDLQKIGIYHGDLHFNNVSKLRGKVVPIDFGPESCYIGRRRSRNFVSRDDMNHEKFFT